MTTLVVVGALGCAAMAGVFFAFSGFVLAGLARLPAGRAVAAMQSINVTAVRPPLMVALFGTAAACVVLGVLAVLGWGDRRAVLVLAGSLLYLVGVIGVTAAYHVPHNNALAAVEPTGAEISTYWNQWVAGWARWNHVRAAAALAAALLLTLAIRR